MTEENKPNDENKVELKKKRFKIFGDPVAEINW